MTKKQREKMKAMEGALLFLKKVLNQSKTKKLTRLSAVCIIDDALNGIFYKVRK